MAKIISLRAPESMRLQDMSEQDIEAYVKDLASRTMDNLPEGVKPVGVSAVEIDELRESAARETTVWAQWTRACCGHADRIVDFEPPVLDEFAAPGSTPNREAARAHVESQLRTAALEYREMHGGSGGE